MKQARITRLHPILSPPKNEEAPFFDPCPKFQKMYHPKCSLDRIISYLFLKQNNINGKTFSQRRTCKLDATQTHDGPAKCRVLKIHPPDANKINGWQNVGGEVSYDYENGWKTRLADICTDIQEDINIMRKVLMDEGEQKHNYKARIEYLKRYIEEINKMFHIVNLKDDIKKLRGIYRKSREEIKTYVKLKGTRFFEIVLLNQSIFFITHQQLDKRFLRRYKLISQLILAFSFFFFFPIVNNQIPFFLFIPRFILIEIL